MSESSFAAQAELAAARVDQEKVGFDPVTIITILTTVLPLLAKCFNRNDSMSTADASDEIKRMHEQNPKALERRTARRIRAEAEQPMTKAESFEFARAVIDHVCEADSETVSACCAEAGT